MKHNRRLLALCAVLAATLGIVFFGPPPSSNEAAGLVSTPLIHSTSSAHKSEAVGVGESIHVEALRSRERFGTSGDAFYVADPPDTHIAAVVENAAPVRPANPFEVIGKERVGDHYTIFLSRGDDTFAVEQDTRFADDYRVDSIDPPRLKITYLPMSEQFEINIGVFD